MGKGIFGNLFDFNGDGKLDAVEQAADFMAFDRIMNENNEDGNGEDLSDDEENDLFDENDLDSDDTDFI